MYREVSGNRKQETGEAASYLDSTRKVGTVLPPPAVTLSNGVVARRVKSPSR
jgi:hypothetical protein